MQDVSSSCRLYRVRAGISSIPLIPSAAGWTGTNGTFSDIDPKRNYTPQDSHTFPPFEDLFSEFQGDGCIERLGELAESLLQEVTSGVEASSTETNEQVSCAKICFLVNSY